MLTPFDLGPTRASILIAGAACLSGLSGCYTYQDPFEVEATRVYLLEMPAGTDVHVTTSYGDIEIVDADEPTPHWAEGISIARTSPDQAVLLARFRSSDQARLDALSFEPRLADGGLHLQPTWPAATSKSKDASDFVLLSPVHVGGVQARTGYGDIDIEVPNKGGTLSSGYGDVGVHGPGASLTVDTGYGDVVVSDAAGPLSISSGYGDVTAGFEGSQPHQLTIGTGYGDVFLANATIPEGAVAIRTGYGDIDIDNARMPESVSGSRAISTTKRSLSIDGDADQPGWSIKTGYGDVDIDASMR